MAAQQLDRVIRHLRRSALLRDHGDASDGQLLDRFIDRQDKAAFETLVRRHESMVLSVCRRVLGNTHDAEDAFQATFLVLVHKAASLGMRELVGNWLYGVAYRTALEARTLAARRRVRERQVSEMPEPAMPEAAADGDLRLLLDRELSQLPDKYRVPVVLCDLEGQNGRKWPGNSVSPKAPSRDGSRRRDACWPGAWRARGSHWAPVWQLFCKVRRRPACRRRWYFPRYKPRRRLRQARRQSARYLRTLLPWQKEC